MDASQWFMLAGGVSELGGLAIVVIGVTNTRRAFTDRPPVATKVLRAVKRLLRIKDPDVTGQAHSVLPAFSSSARVSVSRNWEGMDVDERLRQLQGLMTEQVERIDQLFERVDQEERDRGSAIDAEREERQNVYSNLEDRIRLAAAGGLTQETVGVTLFIVGVALSTIGSLIQP